MNGKRFQALHWPDAQWQEWPALPGGAQALALLEKAAQQQRPVLWICENALQAQLAWQDAQLLNETGLEILHFPGWETLVYERFSPHPEAISQRLRVLNRLPTLKQGLCVVDIHTLMQRLAPVNYLRGRCFDFQPGQPLNLAQMRQSLTDQGYHAVPEVHDPGEFAIRGSLLDLFPMGSDRPYRIELFDDEIDTLRSFDPETQRSAEQVSAIRLLPAQEFPTDEAALRDFRSRYRERFDIDLRHCAFYQDLKQGIVPAGSEYFLPLFFEQTASLLQHFSQPPHLMLEPGVETAMERYWLQVQARHEQFRHDLQHPILTPEELLYPPEELRAQLKNHPAVLPGRAQGPQLAGEAPALPLHVKDRPTCEALQQWLEEQPQRLLLACDSAGRREAMLDTLRGAGFQPATARDWAAFLQSDQRLMLAELPISDGFVLDELAVLTEKQLLGERAQRQTLKQRRTRDADALISDLTELHPGAPVVHEDHGVGRYLGLEKLDVGEQAAEFLAIEYAEGARLYVPVSSLHLISRYTGGPAESAPLHRLGGEQWKRARRKAAEQVRDVAAELLDLHARRAARTGRGIQIDPQAMRDFALTFPFEETEDQLKAIEAVLADLQAEQPMDRVVCGDVGFGKTEVALRAAFAVAMAGRQVAVLVPTTLLAQQHFDNFRDRFADWPIRTGIVSRFQSTAENRKTLEAARKGLVDVLVGTHRLLQNDVEFKDLGLVIIDEEQRFGVRQKEQLKKLRAEVDLLTLTATPIPRTLNMAMSGLRDLSIIATPPQKRLAVKTQVSQWDDNLLRDAFQRELQRGGQVYFLHNEVESIERMRRKLAELIPEARIGVAHGQMPERQLEQVMLDFHRQQFNVLLCTTIIENGIDIPTANTIIIHRADRFGLAQLHQLRGRVGRSHHRAYAYLLTPHPRAMTADARKRLEAIQSLEELGAGFTLASHDLEIRGAGELLGDEQSGQIHQVGFSMYMDLLQRAVEAMKNGQEADLEAPARSCEIDLGVPALIPEDYLPDVHTRLTLYKRMAASSDDDALKALQIEMIDRFGLLPEPVKNLFAITRLQQQAIRLGLIRISADEQRGRLVFSPTTPVDPMRVVQLIQQYPRQLAFDGQDKLRFTAPMNTLEQRIAFIGNLLQRLQEP